MRSMSFRLVAEAKCDLAVVDLHTTMKPNVSHLPRRWRIFVALIIGLSTTWSYETRFILPRPGLSVVQFVGLSLYGLTLTGLIVYFLLPSIIRRLYPSFPALSRVLLHLLGVGILAALMIAAIPIKAAPSVWPSHHRIVLTATGERNLNAQGSEVWVVRIPNAEATNITGHVVTSEGWEQRPTGLVSFQQQPATLTWEGWVAGNSTFDLLTHPWSGMVRVEIDGTVNTIDLYTENSGILSLDIHQPTPVDHWLQTFSSVADLIGIMAVVWGLLALFASQNQGSARASIRFKRHWLIYGSICAVVWTGYLLIFWPGFFSNDSIGQWREIVRGQYYDAHPAFHTLTNWLITRFWFSPAAISLAQILAVSAAFGWGLAMSAEMGAPTSWVMGAATLAAFAPMNGMLVITLWKDLFYTAAFVGLSLATLRIALTHGQWLLSKRYWAAFVVLALLTALYRHNGISAAFATPVLLMFFVPRPARWRLGAALITVLGLWWFIRGPVYDWVQVKRLEDPRYTLAPFMSQLAAQVQAGTPLTPEEREYVDSIRSTATPWPYTCYSIDSLFYGNALNWAPAIEDMPRFIELTAKLAARNPDTSIRERLCRLSIVWEVNKPSAGPTYYAPIDLDASGNWAIVHQQWMVDEWAAEFPNLPIPASSSLTPALATALVKLYFSWMSSWVSVFWRPALYMYVVILGVILWVRRARSRAPLALLLPLAMHIALFVLLLPAQDPRYMYPAMALAFSTWPMLFVRSV